MIIYSKDINPPPAFWLRVNDRNTGLPVAYDGPHPTLEAAEEMTATVFADDYCIVDRDGQPAWDFDEEEMVAVWGEDWRRIYPPVPS